jgi:hypothetical protein
MDFKSLLKEIKFINKKEGEKCFICHFPIDGNEKCYKLKCGHFYHEDCIKIKNGHIKCPYCLCHNFGKKCKICKKYYFHSSCRNNHEEYKCQYILSKGINKGKKCSKINCKRHKKHLQLDSKDNGLCKSILKSGKRKGEICNRKNCHYHNKTNKEINL